MILVCRVFCPIAITSKLITKDYWGNSPDSNLTLTSVGNFKSATHSHTSHKSPSVMPRKFEYIQISANCKTQYHCLES